MQGRFFLKEPSRSPMPESVHNLLDPKYDFVLSEQEVAVAKPTATSVIYPNYRYLNLSTTASGNLVVVIPMYFVKPQNFYYYTVRGHSSMCNFEGVIEVRHAAGLFLSSTRLIRWTARKNTSNLSEASIAATITW
jgi:hypothetical protein